VAARDPHFFPEQSLPHHRPSALLLFEADEPDHVEAVGEAEAERKLAALESHRSQLVSTMFVDASSPDHDRQREAFGTRVWDGLAEHGALAGVPLGEAFKAITDL
jgi:LmbE family N-acetylglucosaminyl deacetylase